MSVLILGATAEARALADALPEARRIERAALGRALTGAEALIDASHPFDDETPARAAALAEAASVPRLRLRRAPWTPSRRTKWIAVATPMAARAALAPEWRRVFLTLGRDRMAPFAGDDRFYLVRARRPGPQPDLADYGVIDAPGPYTMAGERLLMEAWRVDALITRNTGGEAARPKVAAAEALNLPIVALSPPPDPAGPVALSVEDALGWLRAP